QNGIQFTNDANTNYMGMGTDGAFYISSSPNISAGARIATEPWVNSQGFLTSVPTFGESAAAGNSSATAIQVTGADTGNINYSTTSTALLRNALYFTSG